LVVRADEGIRAPNTSGPNSPGGKKPGAGGPAKVARALSEAERRRLKGWAEKRVVNAAYCLKHGIHVGAPRPSQ